MMGTQRIYRNVSTLSVYTISLVIMLSPLPHKGKGKGKDQVAGES